MIGVAHDRLRFAAGQKSGDGRKTLLSERGPSPRSGGGLRDQHAEGQPVLDLQHVDGAVAELVEVLEQLDHLILQPEVPDVALRPRAVVAADRDLTDAARQRVQDGVAVEDLQTLDAAEVDALHQLDQALPGFRERGLRQARFHGSHFLRRSAQRNTPRSWPGERLLSGCSAASGRLVLRLAGPCLPDPRWYTGRR